MVITKRIKVKTLIGLCTTTEEVDEIIKNHYHFETTKEKLAFLQGLYDCEFLDRQPNDSEEDLYTMLINAIIKRDIF